MTTSTATSKTKPQTPRKKTTKPKGGTAGGGKSTPLEEIRLCTEMVLDDPIVSIAHAADELPSNIPVGLEQLDRLEAAGVISKKWAPGRVLRVRYLDGVASVQARVTAVAQEWERHANINFVFDNSAAAEIRITFTSGGSWSYLGTDCLGIAANQPTMKYGWLTAASSDAEVRRVVLHEFGHALGLHHEHLSPSVSVPWDKPKVYAYYAATQSPPWDAAKVDANVLNPLNAALTNYTTFDRDSIMLYAIPNDLTIGDYEIGGNQELSDTDRQFIGQTWYPHGRRNIGVADTAVVARETGHLDLFWIAPDGSVRTSQWHGSGWSVPFIVSAANTASPGAISAVSRSTDRLDVFWVGNDGSVRSRGFGELSGWSSVFTLAPAGSADVGSLAAAARMSHTLDVFWVTPGGAVMAAWWAEGRTWSAPYSIAPANSAEPGCISVVARQNMRWDLFWVTQDNGIGTSVWVNGAAWTAPARIVPAGSAEPGSLSCTSRTTNQVGIYWVDASGRVMTAEFSDGGSWTTPSQIAPANSSTRPGGVIVVPRLSNHMDAFWSAPDGALMTAWWHEGQGWSSSFRLSPSGEIEQRSLSAAARLNNQLDVFWVTPNGGVATTYWHDGQAWGQPYKVAGQDASAV